MQLKSVSPFHVLRSPLTRSTWVWAVLMMDMRMVMRSGRSVPVLQAVWISANRPFCSGLKSATSSFRCPVTAASRQAGRSFGTPVAAGGRRCSVQAPADVTTQQIGDFGGKCTVKACIQHREVFWHTICGCYKLIRRDRSWNAANRVSLHASRSGMALLQSRPQQCLHAVHHIIGFSSQWFRWDTMVQ